MVATRSLGTEADTIVHSTAEDLMPELDADAIEDLRSALRGGTVVEATVPVSATPAVEPSPAWTEFRDRVTLLRSDLVDGRAG